MNKPVIWILCLMAVISVMPAAALAQTKTPSLFGGDDTTPIEINAENGIEWQQDGNVFIARGNATATRGTTVIRADELRAYYRGGNNSTAGATSGASEIWRLDAIGAVTITSPGWKASGGHAIYDVAGAVIVLKDANPVTLISADDTITATQQIEFWNDKKMAVARGDATAVRAERRISADVLSAYMEADPTGGNKVRRIEAFDNVKISTAETNATSNRAVYDLPTGLARLDGSVMIVRGDNRLSGCSADFDLGTGISHLKGCPGVDGKNSRVKGILLPGAKTAK